jgi:hypothetical protein
MKLIFTIQGKDIAPRFDLAREILMVRLYDKTPEYESGIVLLPAPGAEELCGFIIKENVKSVICGAIEEIHYDYLKWKKIVVTDNVIGNYERVLDFFLSGQLKSGDILR